jgi:glycosyltransferase involved in cell wall biosynthesis
MTRPQPLPTAPRAGEASQARPGISVVICTYNRADMLPAALEDVLAQDHPDTPEFEVIVVDNNSSDATAAVVNRAASRDSRVRYLFEAQQGLSHARNAAIAAARAPVVAFTDDDVRVGRGWLAAIARAFREHPGASVVGGKVLPVWPAPPPPWLTPAHWGPLALVDYGEQSIRVDADRQICLVGANLAVAARAFELVGTFAPAVQRVRDIVGSSEDHEFLQRLFHAGGFGVYDPRIVIRAAVQEDRLERQYHRRWHLGHGHFHALMRPDYFERSEAGRICDVPAHLFRAALRDATGWIKARLRGDDREAFSHELRLRFFYGFVRTRRRQFLALPRNERRRQWRELARAIVRRRSAARSSPAAAPGAQR